MNQQLNHFQIETLLGEGSFAKVYRAFDQKLERYIALKILKPFWLDDTDALRRFTLEAKMMARLSHPHIVTIYEVGEARGQVYLAEQLIEGNSLEARLGEGSLSWVEMLAILRPIALALDFAHSQGVVHRDIKPANILLGRDGQVYLGDFGLVRAAEGSTKISSSVGGMVGTPAYMAPEQWRGQPATPQTDVYALSCVASEMLTGRVLFAGPTPPAVMTQHVVDGPELPTVWPKDVPPAVKAVLQQGLARDSAERYASAGEFVGQMTALGKTAPVNPPAPSGDVTIGATPRWVLGALGGAALLILILIVAVFSLAGQKGANDEVVATTLAHLAATQTALAIVNTPTNTPSRVPSATPTAEVSPSHTPTTIPSPTPVVVDETTAVVVEPPSATPQPTATPTEKPSATPTHTPKPTATPKPAAVIPQISDSEAQRLWAASGHADEKSEAFVHWNGENPPEVPTGCAKCHSRPGFLDYIGVDGGRSGQVDQAAPIGTVVDCEVCHNDVAETMTSVVMPAGVKVTSLGQEAVCMQCHQGRSSTDTIDYNVTNIKEDTVSADLGFVNIHYFAAAATQLGDIAEGGYQYKGKSYAGKFAHVEEFDSCIECHDAHTAQVGVEACRECHAEVTDRASLKEIRWKDSPVDFDGDGNSTEGVYYEIEMVRTRLYQAIRAYAEQVPRQPIIYNPGSYPYFFVDSNANSRSDEGEPAYDSWTPRLLKAAYNYQVSIKDPGAYTHNPQYIIQLLYDSIEDLNTVLDKPVNLESFKRAN